MKERLKYLLILIGLLALAPGWAQTAVITVDDGDGTSGGCTLAEAIISANKNEDVGGCVGKEEPYGDDTIILETDVELESGHAERPPIIPYYETGTGACPYSDTLTIEGQGHTIDGKDGDGYVLKVSRSLYENLEEYECSYGGVLTVNNATITGGNHAASSTNANMPGNGGGFVNAYSGELTLNNVTVNGNTAAGNGGGIFNARNGILMLNNVTVSGNTVAGDGGGVYMEVFPAAGNSTLNHVTITGNIAEGQGGGIYMSKFPMGGTVALKSSVVISNTALTSDGGNEIFCSGSFTSDSDFNLFGHSDETDAQAFFGFTPGSSDVNATSDGESIPLASILDTTLTDNGGSALTHALVLGSPAIDLDATCSTGLDTDQRGEPRPETEGAGCDAGSFEFSNNCTSNIIVDVDGICTLADAITAANTDTATGGCPAGCGDDTIILKTNVTLDAQLPAITSPITIEGKGYTLDGNGGDWPVLRISVDGDLTLNEATVTGADHTSGFGGGINNFGTVMLTNSTVSGNSTDNDGGGIFNVDTIILFNSTVSGNSSINGYGGGIINSGTVTLNKSTISGNTAVLYGGGITNIGTVTLNDSTISGNTASSGGGIDNYYSTTSGVTVTNSTISGNTGGGISNDNSTVTLINSTVTENTVGGGIISFGNSELILKSSIISGNTFSFDTSIKGNEVWNNGSVITSDSFNLFGHSGESDVEAFNGFTPGSTDRTATSDGTEPTALSGILSPLADNGGSTETHALALGSPAIDLDTDCSTGLIADQRGNFRPAANCDAGAFEGSISPVNMSFLSAVY
ncbi:MAG: right-handed parallel beta-helix repeat-containing protein, partial [Candidatus Electrothrix sp. ATG2]|nr:right-handed parallel beta-helix repeat-containing protein [Candidatus Electrothrix sp. ATG2]